MRDRRFRIEHAQHLTYRTAARFGEQQPDHLLDDADSAIKKLGAERAHRGSYLFRSLLSSNAQLALGSDWPMRKLDTYMFWFCFISYFMYCCKCTPDMNCVAELVHCLRNNVNLR